MGTATEFDVEVAIATWRRFLGSARGLSGDDLDELETHLRDEVDALVAEGCSSEEAFREARRRIGDYATVERAYERLYWRKARDERRLTHELWIRLDMLKNYVKIALRTLLRHKSYTALNLFGLTIGVTCFILILLYVHHELSYDRFHEKADRIHRVLDIRMKDGVGERSTSAPTPLAETLLIDYPEQVEAAVRFFNFFAPSLSLSYEPSSGEARRFNETRFFFTDPSVFEVFDFELLQGDPETALLEPKTLVLTADMAKKYFGDDDPIGKTLRFEGAHEFRVTGVLAPVPSSAHFQFDFLASFASLNDPQILEARLRTTWIWNPSWTYVLLAEGVDPANLETQLPQFVQRHFPESRRDRVTLQLQPLTDIHLHSHLAYEIAPNSNIAYVYIFSAIAVFMLLIACINFVNLATARAGRRAREVGMRKVLGAQRPSLMWQFLGESMLLSLPAVLASVPLVMLLLPILNDFSSQAVTLDLLRTAWFWLGLLGLGLIVGVGAGLYPAVYLSAFRPVSVLKGTFRTGRGKGVMLREGLVVAQFTLSIVLIIGTMVARDQLRLLQNTQLGFDEEQVVMLSVFRSGLPLQYDTFKDRLLQEPAVRSVALIEEVIGENSNSGGFHPEGLAEARNFERLMVWPGVVETLGLEVVAGRAFAEERNAQVSEVLINEAMLKYLGWGSPEEALGKRFTPPPDEAQVVGVVRDFHHASLHREIGPFVLMKPPDVERARVFFGRYLAVRLHPGDLQDALAGLEAAWSDLLPNRPFDYFFLDQELDTLYRSEENLGKLAGIFSLLALMVACLGLFGLAAFMAEQRTREVGVRKVLGATVPGIVALLSKHFLQLVAISIVVAVPLSYFAMQAWLTGFAYRTDIGLDVFFLAGGLALVIALLTVSYQAIRAATADPVQSLRYE